MKMSKGGLALATFAGALGYAVIRYHVAGDVPWRELPVYVLNKAVSLAALAFFAFSYRSGKSRWVPPGAGRFFGVWGFLLMNVHIGLTALVWDASHYGKLFEAGAPKAASNYSMLLGAAGIAAFCAPMWATARDRSWPKWSRFQRTGYAGLALSGLHVAALGYSGWWTPAAWPGYLPPITMISVALAFWPILTRRWS